MAFERGLYYEQFTVGDSYLTQGRTVTESDLVTFAGLSGDYNPLHVDSEFASKELYGRRIVHGLLVQSIASGLATLTGFIDGTAIAFRSLSVKFSLPVFIADTVRVRLEVIDKKPLRRINGGSITLRFQILNQDDKTVQSGEWVLLVKSSPEAVA